jgi:hypothetical protein
MAGARTYTVDTLASSGPGSLEDAIEDANWHQNWYGDRDRIVFSVQGTISQPDSLPAITDPVKLDATTAPGYAPGAPVVELDGGGTAAVGIEVAATAGGTRVSGLAIGGFGKGLVLAGSGSSICANFVGTDPSGTVAAPNGVGIEILSGHNSVGGAGCCGGEGNLVSGNDEYGIVDAGADNHIAGNLIGTDASGAGPLPNGGKPASPGLSGGIKVTGTAIGTLIGGLEEAGPGNVIAFNLGPGITVDPGAQEIEISANSIFANGGLGIEAAAAPNRPQLSDFSATATETIVSGEVTGGPEAQYVLEFFANATCDPTGQGQTFLGTFQVQTDAAGKATFEAKPLLPLPEGTKFITATATGGAGPSTSEFSPCLGEPQPLQPLAAVSKVEQLAATSAGIVPINGDTVAVEPKTGTVRVKLPGEQQFRPLTELETVPVGSTVDTTTGKARITTASAAGDLQSAAFFGSLFKVLQRDGRTLSTMRLVGGNFDSCGGGAAGGAAKQSARSGRHLWGSGKGNFKTEGNYGAATVQGTIWYVADRCNGTFFKVNRGVVAVRDFTAQKTVTLEAGDTYLASP